MDWPIARVLQETRVVTREESGVLGLADGKGGVVGLQNEQQSSAPAESFSRFLAVAPTMTTPAFLPTSLVLTLLGSTGAVS